MTIVYSYFITVHPKQGWNYGEASGAIGGAKFKEELTLRVMQVHALNDKDIWKT